MVNAIELPVFKIRASAIGQIMTNPIGKSVPEKILELEQAISEREEKNKEMKPGKMLDKSQQILSKLHAELKALEARREEVHLSQCCKTYLEKWVNQWVYDRVIDIQARTLDKGIKVEDAAIDYICANVPGMTLISKNLDSFENEWIKGTPDIITDDGQVIDIKSSWSHETFPLYDAENPNREYDWQVLGYMDLTGKTQGSVIYALMSMPDDMIRREARYKLGYNYTEQQYMEFAHDYVYDFEPSWKRIKIFDVPYDNEKIQAIHERVEQCRLYINTVILPTLNQQMQFFKT